MTTYLQLVVDDQLGYELRLLNGRYKPPSETGIVTELTNPNI